MRKGKVPIYLPDRTVIGDAEISDDGRLIKTTIYHDSPIGELLSENLVGFSIMYMSNEARDRAEEHKENKDDESDQLSE